MNRKKPKQTEFLFSQQLRKQNRKHAKGFGGEFLIGKRKEKRPLSDKKPMHLVLRSDSVTVFKPTNKSLKNLISKIAKKHSIKIYSQALNHNHIHFVLKLKTKESYNKFIRELTSKMALAIRQFFENQLDLKGVLNLRPFTRILEWGKDFRICLNYVTLNIKESLGLVSRATNKKPVNRYLK